MGGPKVLMGVHDVHTRLSQPRSKAIPSDCMEQCLGSLRWQVAGTYDGCSTMSGRDVTLYAAAAAVLLLQVRVIRVQCKHPVSSNTTALSDAAVQELREGLGAAASELKSCCWTYRA